MSRPDWPHETWCSVEGCCGAPESGSVLSQCARHTHGRNAPPMKVTCECREPDVQHLVVFGADAAQCRKCGSPMEGTLSARA